MGVTLVPRGGRRGAVWGPVWGICRGKGPKPLDGKTVSNLVTIGPGTPPIKELSFRPRIRIGICSALETGVMRFMTRKYTHMPPPTGRDFRRQGGGQGAGLLPAGDEGGRLKI